MGEKTVPFYIESPNGHDTLLVPESDIKAEIGKQLEDGKWVTVEKKDGNTELLTTKADILKVDPPKEEKKAEEKKETAPDKDDWKNTFGKKAAPIASEDVKSVSATSKLKGG